MKSRNTATMRLLSLALVLLGGLTTVSAAAEDSEATARKQAAKANRLAAKNKCKLAVPAYNRAYRTLKDPTLLFNRAECLRKLGEDHDALRDYELFLSEMPKAPNRAVVEERIAALLAAVKAESASSPSAPAATPEPPQPTAKPVPAESSAKSPPAPVGNAPAPAAPSVEKAAASASKAPPPAAPPAAKAPPPPPHRAEKWTD
jgi:tetratricopeptide (TPR) repeat protein